jgi:LmbE family N-acetylglucosaminyl deacetylase
MMVEQKCIMVIGAHAADAEIMGGATILKQVAAGWRAVIVHMTPGEKGHRTLSTGVCTGQGDRSQGRG